MKKLRHRIVDAGTWLLVVVVVLVLLAACSSTPTSVPQQIHPTHGVDGRCYEWDDEPCDDDPFDLDDLFELKKTTPSPVVVVKKTPAPVPSRTIRRR